jgi:hypothetical protein
MALDALVRRVVATADRIVTPLQVPVTHMSWDGVTLNADGQPVLASIPRIALYDKRQRVMRTLANTLDNTNGTLIFLREIRITANDRFIVPGDAAEHTVMNFGGNLADPNAPLPGETYTTEVYLG